MNKTLRRGENATVTKRKSSDVDEYIGISGHLEIVGALNGTRRSRPYGETGESKSKGNGG
jgi:hypothetical protein